MGSVVVFVVGFGLLWFCLFPAHRKNRGSDESGRGTEERTDKERRGEKVGGGEVGVRPSS
jgi:hypothetical protein